MGWFFCLMVGDRVAYLQGRYLRYLVGIRKVDSHEMRHSTSLPSSGDRVVFCSDGIAEAANVQKELFGFERTAETIRQACVADLSAEAMVDRLIHVAQSFAGDAPQGDDMTVVMLRVGG